MFECVTKALILDKEPVGDYDGLLTLYTEDFGKVSVKAKSIRKITSKLSAHTEPGTLSQLRLVGKNPFQKVKGSFWLVDGLMEKKLFSDFLFLEVIKTLTVEFHADRDLWRFLLEGKSDQAALFTILGFHPRDEMILGGEATQS
ncbi:MAG TPA: recombination protein O N-terminal domain-containing protein [Candidatus Paceibacterota bacterium]